MTDTERIADALERLAAQLEADAAKRDDWEREWKIRQEVRAERGAVLVAPKRHTGRLVLAFIVYVAFLAWLVNQSEVKAQERERAT